jgi:hypothetical protein
MIVVCAKMPLKTSKERAKIPKRSTPFKVVKFFIVVGFKYQMYHKKFKNKKTTMHTLFSISTNKTKRIFADN